jgi:ABC-type cobalamin/Fe3+-siderophores transport system ATPase subunit/nucleoside-triphosphatase THEP1
MELEAQNLSHAYVPGSLVIRDISLKVGEGEIVYVLGRNGSGKTTLLSCLGGILKPSHGEVLLNGDSIFNYAPIDRARQVGLIPQIHVPVFAYSVREMAQMGRVPHLGLFGTPGRTDYEVADEALASVGIAHLRDNPYTEISGGERQLVMIARGLAQQCRILLMDEPDAHLDPKNQARVFEMITRLAGQGLSFVIASHSPNNALIYADRVLLLKDGRAMASGSAPETLTESMLSAAYSMDTEVIYEHTNGIRVPRAILPRHPDARLPKQASADTPAHTLEEVFEKSGGSPQLIFVTGPGGSGKSTWCAGLVRRSRERGLVVRGLLSPAVFTDGSKVGIDMVDLTTGERRRLASLRNPASTGLMTDHWQFDADTLAWGNQILRDAQPCDLLIIDELGPLEFLRNGGLQEGVRILDHRQYKVACVVIRPSLLPDAQQRWPGGYIIDLTKTNAQGRAQPFG